MGVASGDRGQSAALSDKETHVKEAAGAQDLDQSEGEDRRP